MEASEHRHRAVAEAADWWVQLQSSDVPAPIRERYVRWLCESPVHVAEMLRVAQVHGALEQFGGWAELQTSSEDISSGNVIPLVPFRRRAFSPLDSKWPSFRIGAITACLGLIVIATIWLPLHNTGESIVTARGERREVALNDGSTVQLDPETKLRVQFSDRVRSIALERGRALFKVAKNPNRPFEVRADDTLVRAVGTAFGVDHQSSGVVVTVAEGKVAVIQTKPFSSALNQPDPAPLSLVANQQITVGNGSAQSIHEVNSGRALAWAQGRLVFDNERLSAVVAQFNRYNHVQIHVTDASLAAREISGVFDATDPESFIEFFQSVAKVQIDRGTDLDINIVPRQTGEHDCPDVDRTAANCQRYQ
jgi:transmembrane sensor